jgi:acetyl esterase
VLDPYARYLFAQDAGRDAQAKGTEAYFLTLDAMHEGNPQEMLDRGQQIEMPPTLIIQGTADDNIPYEMQERFTAAYQARGGLCDLEIFPGMSHRGDERWPPEEVDHGLELIRAFVARQLNSID